MMHDFRYKSGELYCERVAVRQIADRVGTPFYLYSHKTLTEHFKKLERAFRSLKPLICYSMKANSNLAVLKSLVKMGAGLDIVSGGELFRARRAGCPPSRIVYAGVGKTELEMTEAIRANIRLFNVESIPELEQIGRVAKRFKRTVAVSLRVNPEVDPKTHAHIATGKKETKFGLDLETAFQLLTMPDRYPSLSLCGIHVHIGSQIVRREPFVAAFRKILAFVSRLEIHGVRIRYLNLGGGLGIIYSDERPQTADQFAKAVAPLLKDKTIQLILEPGRFIAGNSGVFVTRTLYVKSTPVREFAIVDGGMNDLIRPALYDSFHQIWPVRTNGKSSKKHYDIVGPICETGDFFAKNRLLPELKSGDLIALASAGAYGFTMASNYNARPRAAEVMVKGRRFAVVKERERRSDLIRGERIPSWV